MSLLLSGPLLKLPAAGGASGNYTFSVVNSYFKPAANDSGFTHGFTPTEGNLLVVIGCDRSSDTLTSYTCTDNGTGTTWTLQGSVANNGSPAGDRRINLAVFTRLAVASGNEASQITVDDGTSNSKHAGVIEIAATGSPGYGYDSPLIDYGLSGTAHVDGTTTTAVSPTGDDILEIAIMVGREPPSGGPTLAGSSFNSPHTTNKLGGFIGGNSLDIMTAITGTSTAAGSKTATANVNGTGTEGIVAILTFRHQA